VFEEDIPLSNLKNKRIWYQKSKSKKKSVKNQSLVEKSVKVS